MNSLCGCLDRGLELEPKQFDRHRLTCFKAELLLNMGDVESSLEFYRQAEKNAEDDKQLCDAWMGLAAYMRLKTRYDEGLALLDKAEPAAMKHHLASKLSRLHHLRGNLCFSLGRADQCRSEHVLALKFGEQSKSAEDEARALGGLGDAEYVRGRMMTAHEHYSRCVELARQHGLGRIEVSHVGQRAWTRLYCGDWQGAKNDGLAAIDLAQKVGDRRAEMNATYCVWETALDLGEFDQAKIYTTRGLDLARTLGARAWEPHVHIGKAFLSSLDGKQLEARDLLTHAVAITAEAGRAFQAARVLGSLAWVVRHDAVAREAALREGEEVLQEGVVGHNYFWFYRFAMEALLDVGDWDRVDDFAAKLEAYTSEEPLKYTEFFIRRGRALAAFGRGKRDELQIRQLKGLHDEARQLGLKFSATALERAIVSGVGSSPNDGR